MTAERREQQSPVRAGQTSGIDGVLDAIKEIGQERAKILVAMKEALLRGDDDEALERARELTGLPTKRPANSRS